MTPTLLIDLFSEQRFFISNLCTFLWDARYMLHNFCCLETRPRLLSIESLLHSSLNLAFTQGKLHNIFIFGMTYPCASGYKECFGEKGNANQYVNFSGCFGTYYDLQHIFPKNSINFSYLV